MSKPTHRYTPLLSDMHLDIESSEIRDLLKLTEKDKEIISFAGGLPAIESFPLNLIPTLTEKAIKKWGSKTVQYGTTEGVTELREALIDYMAGLGVKVNSIDEIQITTGSQQGIHLCGRTLLNPKDGILVADPTYLAALSVWEEHTENIRDINTDENGMVMSELERKLKLEPKKPKFIYDVPTFGNPSGITMSLERRKHLIELAEEYSTEDHPILILEDDPYSALRYEGKSIPPVKAFDNGKHVVYLGTFSKTFAPGLRVGFMVGPEDLIKEFSLSKQSLDLCTPALNQYLVTLYLTEGHLQKQIPKIKRIYKERRDTMLKSIRKEFPKEIKYTEPQGGMFIWTTCPEYIDTKELAKIAAMDWKVAYVSGASFRVHGQRNNMRLNFSSTPPEKIEIGIKRLGELLAKEIEKNGNGAEAPASP